MRTVRSFDFDDYGNPTVLRDFGIEGGTFDDERFTVTTYAHGGNALALWIIDKPDTISVTDEQGAFVSRKIHFYDGTQFEGVQGQIQNRALLHRTRAHVDANRTIEATRSQFDNFGNLLESRDAVGNVRRVTWDSTFQTYPVAETIVVGGGSPDLVLRTAYDLGLGVITSSTNFNGHPTTYHYDSFGRLVKIVRPGDSVTLPTLSFEYQPADPVRGRALIYDADGNLSVSAAAIGSISRVITRQRETSGQPGEYVTVQFSDGCGKSLASLEEGEAGGTWIVKKASSYNLRLQPKSHWLPFQIASASLPHFPVLWPSGRPPTADGVDPAILSTDQYYDPTGRELRRIVAPETWGGPRRETAAQYLPFRQRVFDEEDLRTGSSHFGTPHEQSFDGLNRLVSVEEVVKLADGGSPGPLTNWVTEYGYDLNNQLIRIKDSQGNVKTMGFDALQRMTNAHDPNRGRMSFVYDDASNLRETRDAKGQRIVYTYDGANRIKTEDYQDGGARQYDVEYFYDLADANVDLGNGTRGTANNTRGQLAYVRDLSGERHMSYDSRARMEWEVKRVADRLHGQLVSFQTRFRYDAGDRLELLTYPDGDEVKHEYNARNLAKRIHGASLGDVIRSISYRPSGQLFNIEYGNGVGTSHLYDPRLRLTNLTTTNSQNLRLIDFAYAFDGAANVERIEDRRNLTDMPDASPRFNTQVFSYDNLYRLTRAEYPRFGTAATNHVAYQYDRIGNMLSQTSDIVHDENGLPVVNLGTMDSGGTPGRFNRTGRNAGDPAGPHALTAIRSGGAVHNYQYDDNGNMTSLDGLTCQWDFLDRLIAVENENIRATYTYDYTHRRITKTVHWKSPAPENGSQVSLLNPAWRTTSTHYINRYFEVREHDAAVKYVWNGETRVARVTASLGGLTGIQHLRLQPGWNNVCLQVGGQFPVLDPTVNSDIGACAYWSDTGAANGLVQVTGSTSLPAGSVLWINAKRDLTVILVGVPGSRTLPTLTGGSQFIGNSLAEPLDLASVFPANAWIGRLQTHSSRWRFRFPTTHALAALNDLSQLWLPGESLWTTGGNVSSLGTNLTALRVQYYHQDHLGSTCVIADQNGQVVEENANYAFGHIRNSFKPGPRPDEPYGFTQKERDAESALHYFESRYYLAGVGRFQRPDSLQLMFATLNVNDKRSAEYRAFRKFIEAPQKLNPYSYVLNNPVRYYDELGLEETEVAKHAKEALEDFEKDNPDAKGKAELSSGNRTAEEQVEIILQPKRADNYLNIKKNFKEKFSLDKLPAYKDLTTEQKDWFVEEVNKQAGKSPGFPHVGGKAQDIKMNGLNLDQKKALLNKLDTSKYDVYKEKVTGDTSEYGVSIEDANVFHVYEP